jgi:hypothetical protein
MLIGLLAPASEFGKPPLDSVAERKHPAKIRNSLMRLEASPLRKHPGFEIPVLFRLIRPGAHMHTTVSPTTQCDPKVVAIKIDPWHWCHLQGAT